MKTTHAWIGAVLAAGAVTLGACGDDDSGGGGNAAVVVESLVSEGATEEEARCFVDELGADDAERLVSADDDELSEREMARLVGAFTKCSEDFPQDDG